MSIFYEDECVGCPPEIGCLGSSCRYKNVPHLVCDECKREFDKLYLYDSLQVCEGCLLGKDLSYLKDEYEDIDEDNVLEVFDYIDYQNLPEPEEPDYDDWDE